MDVEEFRHYGHQIIDWIADYLSNADRYPVLAQVEPGKIKSEIPSVPPADGEAMDQILADVDRIVLPGLTHWNHPAFFAYFAMNGSIPGILGDMLATALNVNAMMWRTSPAATELEEVTVDWLRQLIGLPDEFSGLIYDTASMSSLCAIAAARETVSELNVRELGLAGVRAGDAQTTGYPGYPFLEREEKPESESDVRTRLRMYTSEQSHSSIEKAAITLGIGQSGVKKVSTDREYRMDPDALATAIEEDREGGYRPFCVVATVGTTSTTSIDPVPAIASICEKEQLWLHVDAAFGGSAAVVPEMRWVLNGCERADSLVINPHKWFFVPFDLSVLYCRRMEVLRQAFSLVPEYLRSANQDEVRNYMDYGPQLGRRFRALKLWFAIRYFGSRGLADRIREHLKMAHEFAQLIDKSDNFERLAPVPLSAVCFRAHPAALRKRASSLRANTEAEQYLNELNERLMDEVNRQGKIFISHTKLDGKYTLRLAIGHIRTTREHIDLAWMQLNEALVKILNQ
jgi:aromatic-L-amino-acid decarboxylase